MWTVVFLLSFGAFILLPFLLILGLINPRWVRVYTRRRAFRLYGGLFTLSFVLVCLSALLIDDSSTVSTPVDAPVVEAPSQVADIPEQEATPTLPAQPEIEQPPEPFQEAMSQATDKK